MRFNANGSISCTKNEKKNEENKFNERLRFFTSKESNMHKVTNSGRTYFNQCFDVIVWDDCDSF